MREGVRGGAAQQRMQVRNKTKKMDDVYRLN
jgi:hypothetical protein